MSNLIDLQEPIIRQHKLPSHRKTNGLIRYGFNKTSQNGEDGIIQRIFDLIPLRENQTYRWCIDVGAWDGKHLSNTYSLLTKENSEWRGILIEAETLRFQQLQDLYYQQDTKNKNICIHAHVSCDQKSSQRLSTLLDTHLVPQWYKRSTNIIDIDFISIDVDGCDYWVLHDLLYHPIMIEETSITAFYRPLVICIEFNPTIPHEVVYIPPRNDAIRHGCSLSALCELLAGEDGSEAIGHEAILRLLKRDFPDIEYVLVETTCYNAFFVRKDIFDLYITGEVPYANNLDALHQVTMGTKLYQLYDGTIKLSGCKKLLWHRIPIEESEIQILKKQEDRVFPFSPKCT